MNPRQIERFFKILSKELAGPATAIITGAAAGSLMGKIRPSIDIDFAIESARKSPAAWQKIEEAVRRAEIKAGIPANFAQDIDRWGMISLLDYKRKAKRFKRWGKLEVKVMDPAYWSIGKMTRYLEPDVRDMIAVFKARRVSARRLAALWAKALRHSPPSTALILFRKQAENFLRAHGKTIWGPRFDASDVLGVILGR